MLLTARHVKTWVDRFGAALDTLHVVDAKAFGLPPDKVPNVLLRRTADLKHYCDYYFGGTVVPGKQSPTVFIIPGGWSAFRKQSKLPYSREHFKPWAMRPSSEFPTPVRFAFPDTSERRSPGVGY